ncbi:MAG TPA: hypothetical protein VKT73_10235 [Xanthobacteraceae bacterium]|nr:hypothetical protein [Xanthobacteraceae bacterium]
MRRRISRAIVILAPILLAGPLAFAGSAVAQTAKTKKVSPKDVKKKEPAHDLRSWNVGRDASGPVLFYGRTQNEDVSVSFTCLPDSGLVRVIAYGTARGVKPGDGARLRLTNGPAKLEVAAIALPNDKNTSSVDLGGTTKISPRVFALFRGGDAIVVEVPGRTIGLSLKTLPGKNEAFERACLGGRAGN